MSIVLHARLLCTRRLLENRGTMAGVWLFQAVLRTVLLAGLCVSVWMLSTLHRHAAPLSAGARAALYALFAAAAVFAGALYALVAHCTARWFLQNARCAQRFRSYFARFSFRETCAVLYSFWLRRVLSGVRMLAYLAPALAGAGALWLTLRAKGLSVPLLLAAVLLETLALLAGLYFGFADVQRYAFVDAVFLYERCGVLDALRESRRLSAGLSFACANARLRFLPWAALCVLVLPVLYVAPYARQSAACVALLAVEKRRPAAPAEKPVVFLCAKRTDGCIRAENRV